MLAPNTSLQNRYLIVRAIGQGGMGAVYMARDERLRSIVALKESFFSDERMRRAFEREAELLANLHHPALPNVIDHFTEGDGQFLVMQFIPGDDLGTLMLSRNSSFAPEEVLDWADQLLDALDYLHQQPPPIIHRDIKPQNLKLTARGQIILLDFGLAKGSAGQMSSAAASRSVLGFTPNFAPLEQIEGEGTDARSDLYALAATVYYLLTGVVPPDALSRVSALVRGKADPLRPAHEINPLISEGVAKVLHEAMAQNPDARPQTAAAMRAALRDAGSKAQPISQEIAAPVELPQTIRTDAIQQTQPASAFNLNQAQAVPPTVASPTMLSPVADNSSFKTDPVSVSKLGLAHALAQPETKRRGKLWLGLGAVALGLIVLIVTVWLGMFSKKPEVSSAQAGGSPQPSAAAQTEKQMPPLQSYQFVTVTLDINGNETERRTLEARSFTEKLGTSMSLEMVEIPAGTFMMGSTEADVEEAFVNTQRWDKPRGYLDLTKREFFDGEMPQHQVNVPAFFMGKFEVTQAQWRVVAGWPKVAMDLNLEPSYTKGDSRPVESITWEEAVEFCKRLSAQTGRAYRLPSEAEWEYAARAGTTTPFGFGATIISKIENFDSMYPYLNAPRVAKRGVTTEVGILGVANRFGLYDMFGNVAEFCEDAKQKNYQGAPTDGSAWGVGSGYDKVWRGGSLGWIGSSCRSANRGAIGYRSKALNGGFRIVTSGLVKN
jgi:formylglycine-generating enzyme required for sulfatase activity